MRSVHLVVWPVRVLRRNPLLLLHLRSAVGVLVLDLGWCATDVGIRCVSARVSEPV